MTATILVVSLSPLTVRAEDPVPDAGAIRERVRAASPVPADYRETTQTVVSNGTTSTVTYIKRGSDWREIVARGPFHTESGSVKGEDWHQNDNGQTVYDEPDPGVAKPDPTTESVKRVHAPVDAYVVAELNARGWGERQYIDPLTWQLIRYESVGPNGNVTTIYDDVRADGGRTFAHHWATVNDYRRTKSDTRVTAYDQSAVSDADVAVPNSRRHLIEFSGNTESADLPVTFGADHIIVRVTINGRGLDFLLDSGADGITLDNNVARQLGLTVYDAKSAVTADRYTTGRTIVPEMHVGTLTMRNVAVQLVPNEDNESDSIKTVGLLGFDFLAELGVTIDYEHKRVTAVIEPDYEAPHGKNVIALDVRIGDGSPFLNVAINGALSERFLIDTGGAGAVMIFDAFKRKHPEALVDKGGGGDVRDMRFAGIGGDVTTKPYQLASVRVGPINMVDFVAYVVTSHGAYAGDYDGIIGPTFLRLFDVGLDYVKSRVYLVPNAAGREAMGIKQ